jgi:hypothetical protein
VNVLHHPPILRPCLVLGLVIGLAACDKSPKNPKLPRGAKS